MAKYTINHACGHSREIARIEPYKDKWTCKIMVKRGGKEYFQQAVVKPNKEEAEKYAASKKAKIIKV